MCSSYDQDVSTTIGSPRAPQYKWEKGAKFPRDHYFR
jgi:hypothetical protein